MALIRYFVRTLFVIAFSCTFNSQSSPQSREDGQSRLSVERHEPFDFSIEGRAIHQVGNFRNAALAQPTVNSDCREDQTSALAAYSILAGTTLRIALETPVKLSKLKTGGSFDGVLLRALYSQGNQIVPAGTHIRLIVDNVERKRATNNRKLAWLSRVWQTFPEKHDQYSVSFRSAILTLPGGETVPVSVLFGWMGEPTVVQAKPKGVNTTPEASDKQSQEALTSPLPKQRRKGMRSILILELARDTTLRLPGIPRAHSIEDRLFAGAAVPRARLSLLTRLSASKNHEGDWFRARLVEPVRLDGRIIFEGSLFEGRITRQAPPRRLRRPGLLYVNFERIIPPVGPPTPISSSITSIEADRRAHLKMDSEGMLHGRNPGIGAVALDIGVFYLLGKAIDDLLEEGIKAAVAGVTSESAASISRYFGIGTGLCLFLVRRGRDVTLEEYSEFEVTFRPQADFQTH